ncbi:MAG: hypothetical protein K9K88_17390, partial [Desulfobacterales bacterium]|nr:hypothetical protein [Desulfobacterales bacterium]
MDQLRTELKRKRTGSGRKWPLAVAVIFFGLFFCLGAQPAWAQAILGGGGNTLTYTENDGKSVINGSLSIGFGGDIDSAQISVSSGYQSGEDFLACPLSLPSGVSCSYSGGVLDISTTSSVPIVDFNPVLQGITYENTIESPTTNNRIVDFVVTDTSGTPSAPAQTTITVAAVNDAPTGGNGAVTTNEDTAHTFASAEFSTGTTPVYSDVEGDAFAGIRLTSTASAGTLELSGVAVTGTEVISSANIA